MRSQSRPVIKIHLADDHSVVRAGFRQILEKSHDLQVISEASNGREACQLIENNPPDVAVIDIQMPEMNGIEVTRWIRSKGLEIGVLIITAYDDEPYVRAVLHAGANGYIMKTAEPREIIQAIYDVYTGKPVIDAALTQRIFTRLSKDESLKPLESLTEREIQIILLAAKGYTNKAIGAHLDISDRTVQNHLANIYKKMNVTNRTEAVMIAVSMGLIPVKTADDV